MGFKVTPSDRWPGTLTGDHQKIHTVGMNSKVQNPFSLGVLPLKSVPLLHVIPILNAYRINYQLRGLESEEGTQSTASMMKFIFIERFMHIALLGPHTSK